MSQWLSEVLSTVFSEEGVAFVLSLLPVSEIRGGLIYARAVDMDWLIAFLITYIGNMLPIPFILLLLRKVLNFLKRFRRLGGFINFLQNKATKASEKVKKYQLFGLFLLVAIPLPGTGAWTGALVADFMDIRMSRALPTIALGVLAAGAIMSLVCYGIPGLLL